MSDDYPTRSGAPRHVWEIQASEQVTDDAHQRTYWDNVTTAVITSSLERAIDLFRTKHPDAVLHRVERRNYMGRDTIIVDQE